MAFFRKLLSLATGLVLVVSCFGVSAYAADDIMHGAGYVMTSRLRLYSRPSSDSDVIDTASGGDRVVVIEEEDDWCYVSFNLQEGYMRTDCLEVETQENVELGQGKVTASVAYLRSGPGTEYSILSSGFQSNEYYVLGIFDGWYKLLKDNQTCYIRSDLMKLTEIPYENEDSETDPQFFCRGETIAELPYEETEPVAVAAPGGYYGPISGSSLLAEAQKYIGTPYVFGGATPDGFDCSGLIFYALGQLGYPAPRTAAAQYSMGTAVDRGNLAPGDLVFFENTYTSGVSHVGIYAGGNTFLHAPNEGSTVSYSSLSGYWASHYCGARRLG